MAIERVDDCANVRRGLHLREEHARDWQLRDHRDVVITPGGVERVDADDDFAITVPARRHRGAHLRARHRLGVRRNRVFQIEDHGVARQFARLRHGALVRAGHEQYGATGRHIGVCWLLADRRNSSGGACARARALPRYFLCHVPSGYLM